ncbi:MAG TPA: reverse transcriptase family protein [Roseiflexaceae bacterium]|nr:reverse transcriptase family protein [Roseiflexaceae bacterium]
MIKKLVALFEQLFGQRLSGGGQPADAPATPQAAPAEPAAQSVAQAWVAEWDRQQQQRAAQRAERQRQAWARDRSYFGEETWGVSRRHRAAVTDEGRLARYGLPLLRSEAELAEWLEISRERLRWFTQDRPADRVWHYVRHARPKRSGGERVILAPKRELKALQRRVLHDLLDRVPPTEAAHGFRPGRSTATNAQPHTGQQVLVNLDLKDFFPSITYPRVRGILVGLGYSYAVAATLALLCTEHDRVAYDRDDGRYYISVTPRALPQGAPTSPALANLAAARLDRRLGGLAAARGWAYTRYADDLTFSGGDPAAVGRLIAAVKKIVAAEDFVVHPDKIHVARRSGRQEVTGLVVNDAVGTPRRLRRQLRAILHNAGQTGLAAQNREGRADFRAYLAGMIGHISAANAAHGERLRAALRELR